MSEVVRVRPKSAGSASVPWFAATRLREVLDALPAAIYTTDAQGRITYYNEAAVDFSGRRPQLGDDRWCVSWKLYRPDGSSLPHDECPMALAVKERRPVRGCEAVAERPDGTRVPFIPYPTPLFDADGELIGAVNMLVDISRRKEAETRQAALIAELQHRVKNNAMILSSLLTLSAQQAAGEEAQAELVRAAGRAGAMAAAHRALYRNGQESSFDAPAFFSDVCATVSGSLGPGVEIKLDIADVVLPNDWATPLALIFNELVSNAARHGRSPSGQSQVRVRFARADGAFELSVDDDGPGFVAPAPSGKFSGLELTRALAAQLRGELSVACANGARCTVRFPA
jgi:PAS domain S-box-containing protein